MRVTALTAVAAIACGTPSSAPAPTTADRDPAPIVAAERSPAVGEAEPPGSAACDAAVAATVEHARALHAQERHATEASVASITAGRFECVEILGLDLDGDGGADLAVTQTGGGSMPGAQPYFLFVAAGEEPRFVGHVNAHPIAPPGCATSRTEGLCDVHATELMIHGEEVTHRYRFDGSRYQDTGVVGESAPEP